MRMKITVEQIRSIRKRSLQGFLYWHNISKPYKSCNFCFLLIPLQEESTTVQILRYLDEYLAYSAKSSAVLITPDPNVPVLAQQYSANIFKAIICSDDQSDALLAYCLSTRLDKRFIIGSLSYPNTRKLLFQAFRDGLIREEQLITVGVFGMTNNIEYVSIEDKQ